VLDVNVSDADVFDADVPDVDMSDADVSDATDAFGVSSNVTNLDAKLLFDANSFNENKT
jgi:hypothetical protein